MQQKAHWKQIIVMWLGVISYLKVINGSKMRIKIRKMMFPDYFLQLADVNLSEMM